MGGAKAPLAPPPWIRACHLSVPHGGATSSVYQMGEPPPQCTTWGSHLLSVPHGGATSSVYHMGEPPVYQMGRVTFVYNMGEPPVYQMGRVTFVYNMGEPPLHYRGGHLFTTGGATSSLQGEPPLHYRGSHLCLLLVITSTIHSQIHKIITCLPCHIFCMKSLFSLITLIIHCSKVNWN